MRLILTAVLLTLATAPAVAQSTGRSSAAQEAPAAEIATGPAATQQQVRDTLKKAGFQDIQIMDSAFVVHARAPDGSAVVMYFNAADTASKAATTGASRADTGPSPEAPVVDRANANIDRYKTPAEKAKPDPFKEERSDPNKTQ
jgi:hypothetical protein